MRTAPLGSSLSFLSQPLEFVFVLVVCSSKNLTGLGAGFSPETQSLSSDMSSSLQTFPFSILTSFTFLPAFLCEASSGKQRAFDSWLIEVSDQREGRNN